MSGKHPITSLSRERPDGGGRAAPRVGAIAPSAAREVSYVTFLSGVRAPACPLSQACNRGSGQALCDLMAWPGPCSLSTGEAGHLAIRTFALKEVLVSAPGRYPCSCGEERLYEGRPSPGQQGWSLVRAFSGTASITTHRGLCAALGTVPPLLSPQGGYSL